MPRSAESLIVFSDVHLGSDLNDSGPSVPRSAAIDADLAEMLAHYGATEPPVGRWRVVVAGDFIDFVGMSIDPRDGEELETEPTAADRKYGLGGAEDHVRLKLRRVAARHRDVLSALGRFVAAGNALTIVQGNHDLELHWDGVQRDFCALLFELGEASGTVDELSARVEFVPWFFYREGLVYIEHGNQYDPFCSIPFVLAPLSPRDPRRVGPTLSDLLLKYIVRRTRGMKEYGHEERGLASYISWGLLLGASGTAGLFVRFWEAVLELWRTATAHESDSGRRVRSEHERRLRQLAEQTKIPEHRIRAALALQCESMGRTPRGVLASVMLDRLGVFCVMMVGLGGLGGCAGRLNGHALHAAGALLVVWAALHVWLSRGRPKVDPGAVMVTRAADLAVLFPCSFVVMGHTHVPLTARAGDAAYVNLGSWAEEEPDPGEDPAKVYRAARTHLVLYERGGIAEGRFCEWRSGVGPHVREVLTPRSEGDAPATTDTPVVTTASVAE